MMDGSKLEPSFLLNKEMLQKEKREVLRLILTEVSI